MNPAKVPPTDSIDFLIGPQQAYSCTEAERVHPDAGAGPAPDASPRRRHRLVPSRERVWDEAPQQVEGCWMADDSMRDKLYRRQMEWVTRHWSGKHRCVGQGSNRLTLLWTDGERYSPVDDRIYDKAPAGLTKNEQFRAMLEQAHQRGFTPDCVLFDRWEASWPPLQQIRALGWRWVTGLECQRHVNPDGQGKRRLDQVVICEAGTQVHLKGYGFIPVGQIVATNGDMAYGATAPRNPMEWAGRAFWRLEFHCFTQGISWFAAKISLLRDPVRAYLAHPLYGF